MAGAKLIQCSAFKPTENQVSRDLLTAAPVMHAFNSYRAGSAIASTNAHGRSFFFDVAPGEHADALPNIPAPMLPINTSKYPKPQVRIGFLISFLLFNQTLHLWLFGNWDICNINFSTGVLGTRTHMQGKQENTEQFGSFEGGASLPKRLQSIVLRVLDPFKQKFVKLL